MHNLGVFWICCQKIICIQKVFSDSSYSMSQFFLTKDKKLYRNFFWPKTFAQIFFWTRDVFAKKVLRDWRNGCDKFYYLWSIVYFSCFKVKLQNFSVKSLKCYILSQSLSNTTKHRVDDFSKFVCNIILR